MTFCGHCVIPDILCHVLLKKLLREILNHVVSRWDCPILLQVRVFFFLDSWKFLWKTHQWMQLVWHLQHNFLCVKQLSFSFSWSKLNFLKALSVNNHFQLKCRNFKSLLESSFFFLRSNTFHFTRRSTNRFRNEFQPHKRILIAINLGFSKQNKTLKEQKYFCPRSPDFKWHERFLGILDFSGHHMFSLKHLL